MPHYVIKKWTETALSAWMLLNARARVCVCVCVYASVVCPPSMAWRKVQIHR
jgi:hypothetical protein